MQRLVQVGDPPDLEVLRLRIFYDWRHPVGAVFSPVPNEFGDFPMMRRMLLGLKRRAEAT